MPRSQLLIIFFVSSFAISGIIESIVGGEAVDAIGFAHVVVIAVICFAWCKADVAERDIPMPVGSAIICGVLPVVGVPVHFFRTRQFRSAVIATVKAIAVFAVSILVYGLMLYAGEYVQP